jgi:glutamine---fructose-6-phosphate transaminase (isomerizing)
MDQGQIFRLGIMGMCIYIIRFPVSSPLVVGIGMDEFFLASDATPIVEYTDKVVYLNDEEIAVIRRGEPLIRIG